MFKDWWLKPKSIPPFLTQAVKHGGEVGSHEGFVALTGYGARYQLQWWISTDFFWGEVDFCWCPPKLLGTNKNDSNSSFDGFVVEIGSKAALPIHPTSFSPAVNDFNGRRQGWKWNGWSGALVLHELNFHFGWFLWVEKSKIYATLVYSTCSTSWVFGFLKSRGLNHNAYPLQIWWAFLVVSIHITHITILSMPSSKLTYLLPRHFLEDDFPFPMWDMLVFPSSLEGIHCIHGMSDCYRSRWHGFVRIHQFSLSLSLSRALSLCILYTNIYDVRVPARFVHLISWVGRQWIQLD